MRRATVQAKALVISILCAILAEGGVACSSKASPGEDDASSYAVGSIDGGPASDASAQPASAGDASEPSPSEIRLKATNGVLSLPFAITMSATTSGKVTRIELTENTGTITLDGTEMAALVYAETPAPQFGIDQFNVLAVAGARWAVLFVYCTGDVLSAIWSEDTGGEALSVDQVTGVCKIASRTHDVTVMFPECRMPPPRVVSGFQIHGTDVDFDGTGAGTIRVDGTDWALLPFQSVDCSTECGTTDGWWELHSLMWDARSGRAAFVILYLFARNRQEVMLIYRIDVPDIEHTNVSPLTLPASWSHP
jgi:hypothetical protein